MWNWSRIKTSMTIMNPLPSLRMVDICLRDISSSHNEIQPPREIYVKQAEYFTFTGTLAWSTGMTIFLFDLKMHITLLIFIPSVIVAYLFGAFRYLKWREP